MQHVSGVSEVLIGWGAILAGLAILAALIAWADRRQASTRRSDVAGTPATLDPRREWDLVIDGASEGLSRSVDLATLQADTALKIEAAEHAYNRLVADFAKLCGKSAPPVTEPAWLPVSEPKEPPSGAEKAEQPPLAA